MAAAGRIPDGVVTLATPLPNSQPRLAPGCRWATHAEKPVVLYPEGMIRIQGTGQNVLELCDGERTVQQIVEALAQKYGAADPARIMDDVGSFLEALQKKRIVDY